MDATPKGAVRRKFITQREFWGPSRRRLHAGGRGRGFPQGVAIFFEVRSGRIETGVRSPGGRWESAVRKAINASRIELLPDGTIDPKRAAKSWARQTDPARSKVRTKSTAVRTEQDAADAVTLIRRILSEEGAESAGQIDFGMARIAETILKARERELKMA